MSIPDGRLVLRIACLCNGWLAGTPRSTEGSEPLSLSIASLLRGRYYTNPIQYVMVQSKQGCERPASDV